MRNAAICSCLLVLGAACATSHSQTHLDGTVDGTPETADTVPPDTSEEADTGCAPGLTDCSGTCVDTETDIFNCGGCFEACTAGTRAAPVCEEGLCGIVCDAGWSDMDGDGSCETHCVPTSDTEACNGLDDDCDGVADQTFDCVLGRAVSCETGCGSTGSGTCGIDCTLPFAEDCTPPVETCNGSDDDCDGVCDEPGVCCAGTSGPCTTACGSTGTHECTPICVWGACSPPAETCNGADDDCDDACDEPGVCCAGTSGPCTTGCGSAGTQTCTGECDWGACSPPAETYNLVDDDCDTLVDEGYAVLAHGHDDCTGLAGSCPAGYLPRGSFKVESIACGVPGATAVDFTGYEMDAGWLALCSPTDDFVLARGGDDCTGGGGSCPAGYLPRGSFKVDAVPCASAGPSGTAYDGAELRSGWLFVCARDDRASLLLASDDCTGATGGCPAGTHQAGVFKPDVVACNPALPSAVTTDGHALNSGWLVLCVSD